MCFLLSAREVLDDVPTSSAHAIHDFHGFPEQKRVRIHHRADNHHRAQHVEEHGLSELSE